MKRTVSRRAAARTAVLGASAALVATAVPPAFAQDGGFREAEMAAARAKHCVLWSSGGGATCTSGSPSAHGRWAIKVHQHPWYEGAELTIYLPKGVSRCSGPFNPSDYDVGIPHGDFWDNRISSVQSNDATYCNIRMYDHHDGTGGKGRTGYADYCRRLSRPTTCLYYTSPKNKPFDNKTSAFSIS